MKKDRAISIVIYLHFHFPAGTWRQNDVALTLTYRLDVNATSFRRDVPAEEYLKIHIYLTGKSKNTQKQ